MNDAQYDKQIARVRKYVEYWVPILNLCDWDIRYIFSRDDKEETMASCSADWEYKHASITFYLGGIQNYPDAKIRKIVLHELLHVVVNEMREESIKHEERVVVELTAAFLGIKGFEAF